MSRSIDFLAVDPETGDARVMFIQDGVGHEVHASDMGFGQIESPQVSGQLSLASDDQGIEQFVRSFEHAYPTPRD